jgi:RNA polymerase sigma factor (sigma-70 family)
MTALAERSPRQCQVVELRFFGGLNVGEVAHIVGVSERTVKDDWRAARAWLRQYLGA